MGPGEADGCISLPFCSSILLLNFRFLYQTPVPVSPFASLHQGQYFYYKESSLSLIMSGSHFKVQGTIDEKWFKVDNQVSYRKDTDIYSNLLSLLTRPTKLPPLPRPSPPAWWGCSQERSIDRLGF